MATFTTVRTVSLLFLFVLHVLLLGFASAAIGDCLRVVGRPPSSLVVTIIESALVLLLVPATFCGIFCRNAFLSQAWFETAWLGLLAVINFGTTLTVTTSKWSVFCHGERAENMREGDDGAMHPVSLPPCQQYQTLLGLSWLTTVSMITWFLASTAYVSAHAWKDADVWFVDMHTMHFDVSPTQNAVTKLSEKPTLQARLKSSLKSKPRAKPSLPIRVVVEDSLWSDLDVEAGDNRSHGAKSRSSMSPSHGGSRRTTIWPMPQWARATMGKRGVAPAFPAMPSRKPPTDVPTTPVHDFYNMHRERSPPPTPIYTRPANPEPVIPAMALLQPAMRQTTVSHLIRDIERNVVESHRAATQAHLEGLSERDRRASDASWDSRRVLQPQIAPPQIAVSRWSPQSIHDMLAIPRNGMSWLARPYSSGSRDTRIVLGQSIGYDVPSIYSQPSIFPRSSEYTS